MLRIPSVLAAGTATAAAVAAGVALLSPSVTSAAPAAPASPSHASPSHASSTAPKPIRSEVTPSAPAALDLVATSVVRRGKHLVFRERVRGTAGAVVPRTTGQFAGAGVMSYVWPTSLDPSVVGFARRAGVLALAATSHPDFDDTPLLDEDGDGDAGNDGRRWHAHWVVLVPDTTRPDGALKVQDIPAGAHPRLPDTWPAVPLLLDSPGYATTLEARTVEVRVPLDAVRLPRSFRFDGVTAVLRVNADLHDPLLRVQDVFDIASGKLTLPGTARTR